MSDEDQCDPGTGDQEPPDPFDRVTEAVSERVEPDDAERARLREVATTLVARAEAAATERCPEADVMRVGSTARDTWISGDRDVDVFVRFPPDLDRETLESYGIAVGYETLPEGREEYAEHPYVTGELDGFDVDVVPCYRLETATEIRSAVDRTPFHNRYLDRRLDADLAREVRLTKAFLKGIGVYGSNLRTRGFSGYLTELLTLEYDGFRPLLDAAADWHPPVELDPEDHGQTNFDDPLVVIDPTDPERNVAAVCDAANVARLQHYARAMLVDPRVDFFEAAVPEPLSEAELLAHLERRGTTPVAIRFDAPDLVDDQLYPQLEKSLAGVADELERLGFDVVRAAHFVDDGAVLFVELATPELPSIERHDGPPVQVREHAEGFYEAYADDPAVYGPFVDGERYVTEREREFTSARDFLESDRLFDVALGAHVETAIEEGYDVLVGDEVRELCGEFGTELARYFVPEP